MKRKSTLLVAAVLCASAGVAFGRDEGGAQREQMFAKMKDIKLQGMRERVALMQDSIGCVQSAQNQDAMRSCEQRERSAMEEHQRRMKERWESGKPR